MESISKKIKNNQSEENILNQNILEEINIKQSNLDDNKINDKNENNKLENNKKENNIIKNNNLSENKFEDIKLEENKIEENNYDDINIDDNKIEENNLEQINLEDEGKEIELEGQIIFRRIFGKKLAMISLIDSSLSKMTECVTHDSIIIKQLIIGDIIKIKGKISYHKKKQKIDILNITFLKKGNYQKDINKKKKEIISNISKFNTEKSLCIYFKKGIECPNKEKCNFRHFFNNKEEENYINNNKEKQKIAYNKVHIGDIFEGGEKNHKTKRNSEFADFIIEKFGLDNLKKGIILDIAGGKGITSFYLTYKYKLNCLIIDPRGCELPKRYKKMLKKENLNLNEKRIFFNMNNCDDLINNCSLIIGMHPDEVTCDIVDIGLKKNINFAVVPCCVFNIKFPDRKLKNGKSVIEYNDLIDFILEKDSDIQIGYLNIEGRNRVLFKKYN